MNRSRFGLAIALVACPRCGARPIHGCVLPSGSPALSCHNERLRELRRLEAAADRPATAGAPGDLITVE